VGQVVGKNATWISKSALRRGEVHTVLENVLELLGGVPLKFQFGHP
jgi:hypothetical protein